MPHGMLGGKHDGATILPIRGYVESGEVFTPEALSAMGKAFEGAAETLGVGSDEMKRLVVAKCIIRLSQEDESLDAAALRDKTVAALNDTISKNE